MTERSEEQGGSLLGSIVSVSTLAQGTQNSEPFITSFDVSQVVEANKVEFPDVESLFDPSSPVPPGFARSLVDTSIDFGANFIEIDFDNVTTSRFASGFENTYIFEFSNLDTEIVSVSLDEAVSNLGLESSDIRFDASRVSVNVEGLSFTPGTFVRLDVQIDPQPGGAAPVASEDRATTVQGASVAINVLANDSDPDGDSLSLTNVTNPANGQASITNDDRISYTPDTGFTGTDTFTYTISDGNGGADTAQVTVNVAAEGWGGETDVSFPDEPVALVILRGGVDYTVAKGNFVRVFGSGSDSEIVRLQEDAKVELDASFNQNLDTVVLPGSASAYQVSRSGATVKISDDNSGVKIPAGISRTDIAFDDGTLGLVVKEGEVRLGKNAVTNDASPIDISTADVDVVGEANASSDEFGMA